MRASYRLCKQNANAALLDFISGSNWLIIQVLYGTSRIGSGQGYGICYDDFVNFAFLDFFECVLVEKTVGRETEDSASASSGKLVGGFAKSTSSVYHVVNYDTIAPFDLTH